MTTAAPSAARRWPPSVFALLLANTVPLVGVLALHWTVFSVVLLYWRENVIVGGFNVLRMLCAQPQDGIEWAAKAFAIPFFVVHYGMFTLIHGMLVLALFGGASGQGGAGLNPLSLVAAVRQAGLGVAVAALVASHGFSFFQNYLRGGEYRSAGLSQLMARPYGRVVVLHFTILGGGFLVTALGSPLPALVLLIVLKTALDGRAHLAERTKLAS